MAGTAAAACEADPDGQAAEQAVRALTEALHAVGIVLPSLWVDPCPVATGGVLVQLGRARPDVVQRLAGVVARGATG